MNARRVWPWVVAAARGLGIGLLAGTTLAVAIASAVLQTGIRLLDLLIGLLLFAVPLLAILLVLAVPAWLLRVLLRFVARRSGPRTARALRSVVAVLRVIGHPLVALSLAAALVVWASPADGPLGLYHAIWYYEIPIAAAACTGLLAGIAWHSFRASRSRAHRGAALATGALAAIVVLAVATWCLFPGTGDPLVREDPAAVSRIPQLTLPDPSAPGPYRVATATYGSGRDLHRAEYGANVTWRTATVDASEALPARTGFAATYADWYWGFDSHRLPVDGLAWYPADAPGARPVVLIVHGNHDAADSSDPGYAYLAEHLASHGMIAVSVDENFLNGDAFHDYLGREMGVRAWLLLRHLEQFRTWNADSAHPLFGRVDLERVALIGHSRGGEAVAVAAMLEQEGLTPRGLPATPTGFGIKAVVAFAPSDTLYDDIGGAASPTDVDYMVMQGAHDGDLAGVDGLRTYHRVTFSGQGNHLKVALYSQRANHGRFNTVWDIGDAGSLQSWMLDRGSMLSPAEQQRLAKTAVGAFLARSLLGQTGYDAFFREPRSGRAWLPEDIVETHWESSSRVLIDGLDGGVAGEGAVQGFQTVRWVDPGLRDGLAQQDRAAVLDWTSPAAVTLPVGADVAAKVRTGAALVFDMAALTDATPDPTIELRAGDGQSVTVRLSEIAAARPALPTQLWKLPGLGDRYSPTEKHVFPAEHFLQTYAIPLESVLARVGMRAADLRAVTLRFGGSGSVYLDDVAFD